MLLAPTSSILPIQDPVAERRMYFAMLGLLLMVVDVLARLKVDRQSLAAGGLAVLLAAGSPPTPAPRCGHDEVAIWEDTAAQIARCMAAALPTRLRV